MPAPPVDPRSKKVQSHSQFAATRGERTSLHVHQRSSREWNENSENFLGNLVSSMFLHCEPTGRGIIYRRKNISVSLARLANKANQKIVCKFMLESSAMAMKRWMRRPQLVFFEPLNLKSFSLKFRKQKLNLHIEVHEARRSSSRPSVKISSPLAESKLIPI